jgi:hypothetical protein
MTMLSKVLMSSVLLLGVSSFAVAQTTTSPGTGATTSPGTGATTAPGTVPGVRAPAKPAQLTEAQLKQKLAQQGYSDIQLKRVSTSMGTTGTTSGSGSSTSGSGSSTLGAGEEWVGTAMKGGKKVKIMVDGTTGRVFDQPS